MKVRRVNRYQVASPPTERPLMVYDGDCDFCRRWIARWRALTGNRIDYAPFQEVAGRFPEIPRDAFIGAVQLIQPNGNVSGGAEAVFYALAYAPHKRWLLVLYRHVPGMAAISEWFYRFVAQHRRFGSAIDHWLWGAHPGPPTYYVSRWLFLRLLGVVYLIAFVSLWLQIEGLIGSDGILPAGPFLKAVRGMTGPERYWIFPTLCWIDASDTFLQAQCAGGTLLALLLILGPAPVPCLFFLWAFYLSLVLICRTFLSFQWDALLLEAGFLAIFLAPLQIRPNLARESPPSSTVLWLLRWLLFRLVFSSGIGKLLSGDPAWRNLTALNYHYETQPLPTWVGWYLHQLPEWFQIGSVLVMFSIELVVPFLIFAPRRLRLFAFGSLIILQLLIAATGNYAFFNLLSIVLCVLLVDDFTFPQQWQKRMQYLQAHQAKSRQRRWSAWIVVPLTTVVLIVTTVQMAGTLRLQFAWPAVIEKLYRLTAPFRTFNFYGLFTVMTTTRPEIVIEGSADGKSWLPYEFKWKPGDLGQRPFFVAPHQPRLDWQMWFAALGSYQDDPWFMEFMVRLLEGSPQVLALIKHNPFPESPPSYIRALLYEYHFTDVATRRREGRWWRRELKGLYCPVFSSMRKEPSEGRRNFNQ